MRINQLSESNYIDAGDAEDYSRGLIQPTSANLSKFLQFLKEKWTERSKQRHDSWGDAQAEAWQPPSTLEGACKFTSLFALKLFGGRIRGNEHHQYLELPNGKIIDPVPVPDHDDPQYHDDDFWMNPEHKQSLESCLPRVKGWVNEFMSMNESQINEMNNRNSLPHDASWYKGAFPFAALKDDNRRFMFNPVTGAFVIGEYDVLGKGNGVPESHDSEFKASGAPGTRHDYMISGWVGIGGKYRNGVIHFAPPILDMDMEDQAVKQAAMSAIEGFKKSGANKNTVLRNFGTRGERKLGSVTEAVITELTKGVKKGSQKREKIGFASDDPSKYVGKWEEYTEPQGINSKAGKKMTKTEGVVDNMVFYHGQPRPEGGQIEQFKLPRGDDGIYFSNNADYALGYATEFRAEKPDPSVDDFAKTGVAYPVYLNLKNPLILNGEDDATFEKYTQRGFKRSELMAQGYDGIIMKYDDGEIEAQAYDPSQIKSAISEELIQLYRGVNSGQEGNSYYTTDKEWARQFTQSGRDEEIKSVRYSTNRIFKNDPLPKAFGLDDADLEIMDKAWDAGYKGIWMDEGNGQPNSVYFMRGKPSEVMEGSIGPQQTRGLSNSSTGLGAAPPQIVLDQTPWQKKTNGKQKMAGHKAPKMIVRRNVNKSTKNKNRKLNSPVTEVFGDSSNSFQYHEEGGWTTIDAGIEGIEIVVGMEDIKNYNPDLPSGVNVGMVTQTEDGIHMGIEPAKVGMTTKDTIKLFNTLMNIVREYVETNDPDRLYFVAVKPMEGIYQRLIRRFVNTDEWNIKIIKDVPIPMAGEKLNAYMIEKKNLVTEMNRLPKHKQFNADYEVEDNEEMVAKATVNDGVIDEFMIRDDIGNNDFRGKYMSGMMSAIARDADLMNANMSMQINDQDDQEMKRFLERFGFRHVGDGVFRRTAGAITPPSVIY